MIEFSTDERAALVARIQQYFTEELDQELGQFDAEFLLDFFSETIGKFYYNRGLLDAQAILGQRLETLAEAITELEKPLD